MRCINIRVLHGHVAGTRPISVPTSCFDDDESQKSAFVQLFEWLVGEHRLDPAGLLHSVYVGKRLAARLRGAERRRLRNSGVPVVGLTGAVDSSGSDSGPREYVGNVLRLLGDELLFVPDDVRPTWEIAVSRLGEEDQKQHRARIARHATGRTFGEWLRASEDRHDPVGDLAKDTRRDEDGPDGDASFSELRDYFDANGIGRIFEVAWLEWASRFPDRVARMLFCSECDAAAAPGETFTLALRVGSLIISHPQCIDPVDRPLAELSLDGDREPVDELLDRLAHQVPELEWDVQRLKRTLDMWGWKHPEHDMVYFARAAESGCIKIGHSKVSGTRISAIQTGNHERVRYVAFEYGGVHREQELHERFSHCRREAGEWFDPCPELLQYIDSLCSPEATRHLLGPG